MTICHSHYRPARRACLKNSFIAAIHSNWRAFTMPNSLALPMARVVSLGPSKKPTIPKPTWHWRSLLPFDGNLYGKISFIGSRWAFVSSGTGPDTSLKFPFGIVNPIGTTSLPARNKKKTWKRIPAKNVGPRFSLPRRGNSFLKVRPVRYWKWYLFDGGMHSSIFFVILCCLDDDLFISFLYVWISQFSLLLWYDLIISGIGGLGCFTCGAKGKDNFVMDRDRIVEDGKSLQIVCLPLLRLQRHKMRASSYPSLAFIANYFDLSYVS